MIRFPDSYFEDEVRDGFLVPGIMKRAWAAQLEMLEDIKKVCEKHGIVYFAEWGTLLGAVRHGGMIPWDDDLDICMKRKDYERFVEIAPAELPDGYSILSYRSTDTTNMVTKIMNAETAPLDEKDLLRFHGYPYPEVIDLFVMDFLPRDKDTQKALQDLISLISELVYHAKNKDTDSEEFRIGLEGVENICDIRFDRTKPLEQQLLWALEKVANGFREEDADNLTGLPVYFDNSNYLMPKKFYEKAIARPFENTEIAVPSGYDALLSIKYGTDWMKPVRSGGSHGYPSYRRVQEVVKKQIDIEPFHYQYCQKDVDESQENRLPKETLKSRISAFLPLFQEAHMEINRLLDGRETETVAEFLGECQETAIQLGTMIEEAKGEGHPTVTVLEEYCETIFRLHETLYAETGQTLEEMMGALTDWERRFSESIENDLKERKEIVFLPYKESYWGTMAGIWREAVQEEDTDVFVIPVPYYYKDNLGNVKKDQLHYETGYPEEVKLTSYEEYNFEVHHPDQIVTQYPYDEYNYAFTVHPFFYSRNLKKYTDELVYIPPFVTDEIEPGDDRARVTLRYVCNMPGVVFADRVLVQSEQMKKVYVELLTEFAGEETETIWEEKIGFLCQTNGGGMLPRKDDVPEEWLQAIRREDGGERKVLLYGTSASVLFRYGEQAVSKMQDVFRLMCGKREDIILLWHPDPQTREILRKTKPGVWRQYSDLVQEYKESAQGIYDDSPDVERAVRFCHAYYGDGNQMANMCHVLKKPVMIQNVDICCSD